MSFELNEFDKQNPRLFTQLDIQFANFLQRLSGSQSAEVALASRLTSNLTGKGNICVNIPSLAGKDIFEVLGAENGEAGKFCLFGSDEWLAGLTGSGVVGKPGEKKPLIIDDAGRLYLYRYWQYEKKLADNIKARLDYKNKINTSLLKHGIDNLFSSEDDAEQKIVTIAAVLNNFCVISGGPGTGKTSTVIKILALILQQAEEAGMTLEIAIAAPTGKAAARLKESIRNSRLSLKCSGKIIKMIPEDSFTIHRLLGTVRGSSYFRYNSENQLPYDVVIIDESSMADLALTSKLFEAVPVNSRLILLGDRDQLSSVEAGAVLGDICDTGREHSYTKKFFTLIKEIVPEITLPKKSGASEPPIADSITMLSRSYRFGSDSGIGKISRLIRNGEAEEAIRLLRSGKFTDISLSGKIYGNIYHSVPERILKGYSPYLKTGSIETALKLYSDFTILCALRKGPFGVEGVNLLVEDILIKERLISKEGRWYPGRPVLINQNDYEKMLFNGDSGIIMNDPGDGEIYFFSSAADGAVRKLMPLKLPDHETAYAITVHKSQGSEFENVLLLLPDRFSPVLTRELLYTAITRAKKKVEIFGSENILRRMIENPTSRTSGLNDALWSAD
jgi:exodeoxyribonuclease V alpha subunit